ncbi:ribonuclease H-like domain-containing protein [Tanacetum coccineum]
MFQKTPPPEKTKKGASEFTTEFAKSPINVDLGKQGKLNPRYIRPFKVLDKVRTVAYRLELPQQLSNVHSIFHVSDLNKCLSDESLVILLDEIQIDDKLHFVEETMEIMEQEVKRLKQSRVPIVKVRWNSRIGPEFTWELTPPVTFPLPHSLGCYKSTLAYYGTVLVPVQYYNIPTMIRPQASQGTMLSQAFQTMTTQDPSWNMDTGASSHLADNKGILTSFSNSSMYPSVFVGNGQSIPVTHTGHSFLHTSHKPLHLNHILITSHIIKNLIFVCKFTRDNDVSVEFDAYGFSVKDYQTQRLLLHCDSTGDLYLVTHQPPSQTQVVLLSFNSTTWHRRLGHPAEDVLRRLESSNLISCNKSKLSALCHACQLAQTPSVTSAQSNTTYPTTQAVNPTQTVSMHPMVTRAKVNFFKLLERMNCHVTTTSPLPRSHVHALRESNWKEAMLDEYNALITNGTPVLVPRPANANVVCSMWLFKHKFHAHGSLSSGQKKAMVFYQIDTEEVSDRFVAPCFVNRLEAYDGEINLGVEENMISNEYAFIINPEEDDVEPGVIFGRSFLHLTKAITDFGAGTVTIYPNIDPFLEETEEEGKSNGDWDHLLDFNIADVPLLGTSSSAGGHLTQEEAAKEAIAIRMS